MTRLARFFVRAGAALLVGAATAPAVAQSLVPPDCPLLPRDLEVELALSALPKHLHDGATVLVLEANGFVEAKKGTNAFTCEVTRRNGDIFPVCWDAQGTKVLLPVDLDAAKLRLSGKSNAEIEQIIDQGYKTGRYRAPDRTGVSYMLSPIRYRIDPQGKITMVPPLPHTMFYGPGLTDADIGGQRGTILFMNHVGRDGMIIVPVGSAEKAAILAETKSLTERFEKQIGYTAPAK